GARSQRLPLPRIALACEAAAACGEGRSGERAPGLRAPTVGPCDVHPESRIVGAISVTRACPIYRSAMDAQDLTRDTAVRRLAAAPGWYTADLPHAWDFRTPSGGV